jgi:hypothetical protein
MLCLQPVADLRPGAVGILNLCGGTVSGVDALFGGLLKSSIGIDGLLAICAVAYLLAAFLLVIATRRCFLADHAAAEATDGRTQVPDWATR